MSAAAVIQAAAAAGIRLTVDGTYLAFEADTEPPPEILEQLADHKLAIIELLEWQALYGERAGIVEFDGRVSRAEAEATAFEHCLAEWLHRHPVSSSPGQCLACGGVNSTAQPLMPYGTETAGHAWLHFGCWPAWYECRKAEAAAALAAIGITPPRVGTTEGTKA